MSTTIEDLNTFLQWGDQRQLCTIVQEVTKRFCVNDQEAARMVRAWWLAEMEGDGILPDLEPASIVKALHGFESERVMIAIRAAERRDVGKRDARKRLIETAIEASETRDGWTDLIDAADHYLAVFGPKK